MGSSHSQPLRQTVERPPVSSNPSSESPETGVSPSSRRHGAQRIPSRHSSFRRFSSYVRQKSRRDAAAESVTEESQTSHMDPGGVLAALHSTPSAPTAPGPPISSPSQPNPSSPLIRPGALQASPPTRPMPSFLSSSSRNPSISSTVGASTSAAHRNSLLNILRRTSTAPSPTSSSTPPSSPRPSHRLTSRRSSPPLSRRPGLSRNSSSRPQTYVRSLSRDRDYDNINARLASTRQNLEELRRRLARDQSREAEPSEETITAQGQLDDVEHMLTDAENEINAARRRIPSGAVLVVQGLAQIRDERRPDTGTSSGDADEAGATSGGAAPHGQTGSRPDRTSTTDDDEVHRTEGLDSQARLIGGLLTVAAAATASTLLSPHQSPLTSLSRPHSGPVSSFFDRLRPRRRESDSIEGALEGYLRSVLGQNGLRERDRSVSDIASGIAYPETNGGPSVSEEFRDFLESVQEDLVEAVREFAGPLPDSEESPQAAEANTGEASASNAGEDIDGPSEGGLAQAHTPTEGSEASASGTSSAIPTFHRQLGQNIPGTRRSAVTGGRDGQPRRLNFFRAHLFPASGTSAAASEDATAPDGQDPNENVPCLFIGVRSINNDANNSPDEIMQNMTSPFMDNEEPSTPPNTQDAQSPTFPTSTFTSLDDTPASRLSDRPATPHPRPSSISSDNAGPSQRRSFRRRILDRIGARNNAHTPPQGPLSTYLVYVIGGNYPRSHPILAIPNLLTGEPLSDEEMTMIGELLGSVKPPVATQADIEKAGLKVINGSEVPQLCKKGEILDSCLERCLICLSEYEDEETCRVLGCRHAYHKDCIDQWLSKGRNSCPACRTEAVKVTAAPATTETANVTSDGESTETEVELHDGSSLMQPD